MKKSAFIFIITLFLFAIMILKHNNLYGQTSSNSFYLEIYEPQIESRGRDELSDSMTLMFNICKSLAGDKKERKFFIEANDDIEVSVEEYIGKTLNRNRLEYIPNSLRKMKKTGTADGGIPSNITISLLVDRSGSITEDDMELINNAIKAFVDKVPDSCLFLSTFDNDISTSILLTKDNFEKHKIKTTSLNTVLYNAIYTKLIEFEPDSSLPNLEYEPYLEKNDDIADRNSPNNYLIVLTDGKNDVINIEKYKSRENTFDEIDIIRLQNALRKHKKKVKVFTIGFGKNSDYLNEEELKRISKTSGNPNGYFFAEPDSIFKLLEETITDVLTPDYEIQLENRGQSYQGHEREIFIEISGARGLKGQKATGSVKYARGSTTKQKHTGEKSLWGDIWTGILAGFILLLVIMIIIQLLIPLIQNRIFNAKYVKRYRPAVNEIRKECPYCGDPMNPGEKVVMRCKHIVHKVCWDDYDHVCPEYGQNCNEGKQNYFDITDPFSRKNKIYYLQWVLYGLIGGFLTWFIYLLIKNLLFNKFAESTALWISPGIASEVNIDLYVDKISGLFIIGILMGFFLNMFFAYIEDFRRKTIAILGAIFLRGIIGGFCGFLSFYLGSILLIVFKQPEYNFVFDWIPWAIFGVLFGLVLSIKTTIVWKHGLIGGLIAVIFCFVVLSLMSGDLGYTALLIGLMIYGAGLGFSIATVRSTAEQYFLKIIKGKKHEDTIPVHKWMSFHGGHNEVYIGSSFSCEIQMNWEKNNPEIASRHAKMYISSGRNIPVIVSLEQGKVTTFDGRIDMEPGKEYDLFSGNTIQIGNTVFQYLEKD